MSNKISFDYSKALNVIGGNEIESMKAIAENAKELLVSGKGAGNDFTGWVDLPVNYDKEEFARIQKAAEKIRSDSEVLVVIGIGGSYLGARAAIEFLKHSFYNVVSKEVRKGPEIYFVGNSISSKYIKDLMDVIGDRDFSVNVQSRLSLSVSSRRCWRRNTATRKRRRESTRRRTRPEERLRSYPMRRAMRPSWYRTT